MDMLGRVSGVLALLIPLFLGCGHGTAPGPRAQPKTSKSGPVPDRPTDTTSATRPASQTTRPAATSASPAGNAARPDPAQPIIREVTPPAAQPGLEGDYMVAARLFAFSDSQFHYQFGKRTFAQSPFAERMSFEVAVRPAALDEGSDLLLSLFLDAYQTRYRNHTAVFLGDAADLSCEQEIAAFTSVLATRGMDTLLSVTSNHDGFYAGNFTSRRDVDGSLRITDMPHDWTRACSEPGRFADHRLTKGRAVKHLKKLLPPAPRWATTARHDKQGPTDYRDSYLYYVRRLGGGDIGASQVWGVFLDTVDYRGVDFESSRGAGSLGAVSRDQLRFLDRAMFETQVGAGAAPITYVVFGHHPFRSLDRPSRERLAHFLDVHPEAVAYVSAHTHLAMERSIELPGGRSIPELIVGSTTDAPQSARIIEIQVDTHGQRRAVVTRRLVLDTQALCAGIPPLANDALGYTGYRILRDATPDLDIGGLEKLMFALGMDDLSSQRTVQALGALIMENDLVRSLANLYASAPIARDARAGAALERILGRRYAAGQDVAALRPYLRGDARPRASNEYSAWHDPVVARVLAVAELGVHRFGPNAALFQELRALRTRDPDTRRFFACHAAYAAEAEARTPRKHGNVLYIR